MAELSRLNRRELYSMVKYTKYMRARLCKILYKVHVKIIIIGYFTT